MAELREELNDVTLKLSVMTSQEFDEMIEKCGINRIKPSIESDYVRAVKDLKKNEI